jgi:hypothetical protein
MLSHTCHTELPLAKIKSIINSYVILTVMFQMYVLYISNRLGKAIVNSEHIRTVGTILANFM